MTADSPLVSILIPAFNAERFLSATLDSVRAQTYDRWEALVVDDGSSDKTPDLAAEYAAKDSRIRLLRQANSGVSAARNTALKAASGEWTALLDSDDVWLPTKLESQIRLLREDSRTNLLFSNNWVWDGKQNGDLRYRKRHKFPEGDVHQGLIRWCLFTASTVMIPTKTAIKLGGFDTRLSTAEDWDMWLRVAEEGIWSRGVWEPQVQFRVWPGSVTKNLPRLATQVVKVLEIAQTRNRVGRFGEDYRRSLLQSRAKLEMVRAFYDEGPSPKKIRLAALRAFLIFPRRVAYLLCWLAMSVPGFMGGKVTGDCASKYLKERC